MINAEEARAIRKKARDEQDAYIAKPCWTK